MQSQQDTAGQQQLSISEYASKVFAGLKALHIVSSTGAGKAILASRPEAVNVVQLAKKHIKLFPLASQKEFQGWCISSKVGGTGNWPYRILAQNHISDSFHLTSPANQLAVKIPQPHPQASSLTRHSIFNKDGRIRIAWLHLIGSLGNAKPLCKGMKLSD